MKFLITTVVAYVVYLLLTIGSGTVALWSTAELIIGAVLAVVVGAVLRNRFIGEDLRMDYTAVGDTTNLAARIQQTARLGVVWLWWREASGSMEDIRMNFLNKRCHCMIHNTIVL